MGEPKHKPQEQDQPEKEDEKPVERPLADQAVVLFDEKESGSRKTGDTRTGIQLGPDQFDKLDPEASTLLKAQKVERITLLPRDDHHLLVVAGSGPLAFDTDPASGCRKISAAGKIAGELRETADGNIELSKIRGLTADVDPGKDPYLGVPLPWVTAEISKIAITKGEDGKFSVDVTGNWGAIERKVQVPLTEESAERLRSLLRNLNELRDSEEPSLKVQISEKAVMEGVPKKETDSTELDTATAFGAAAVAATAFLAHKLKQVMQLRERSAEAKSAIPGAEGAGSGETLLSDAGSSSDANGGLPAKESRQVDLPAATTAKSAPRIAKVGLPDTEQMPPDVSASPDFDPELDLPPENIDERKPDHDVAAAVKSNSKSNLEIHLPDLITSIASMETAPARLDEKLLAKAKRAKEDLPDFAEQLRVQLEADIKTDIKNSGERSAFRLTPAQFADKEFMEQLLEGKSPNLAKLYAVYTRAEARCEADYESAMAPLSKPIEEMERRINGGLSKANLPDTHLEVVPDLDGNRAEYWPGSGDIRVALDQIDKGMNANFLGLLAHEIKHLEQDCLRIRNYALEEAEKGVTKDRLIEAVQRRYLADGGYELTTEFAERILARPSALELTAAERKRATTLNDSYAANDKMVTNQERMMKEREILHEVSRTLHTPDGSIQAAYLLSKNEALLGAQADRAEVRDLLELRRKISRREVPNSSWSEAAATPVILDAVQKQSTFLGKEVERIYRSQYLEEEARVTQTEALSHAHRAMEHPSRAGQNAASGTGDRPVSETSEKTRQRGRPDNTGEAALSKSTIAADTEMPASKVVSPATEVPSEQLDKGPSVSQIAKDTVETAAYLAPFIGGTTLEHRNKIAEELIQKSRLDGPDKGFYSSLLRDQTLSPEQTSQILGLDSELRISLYDQVLAKSISANNGTITELLLMPPQQQMKLALMPAKTLTTYIAAANAQLLNSSSLGTLTQMSDQQRVHWSAEITKVLAGEAAQYNRENLGLILKLPANHTKPFEPGQVFDQALQSKKFDQSTINDILLGSAGTSSEHLAGFARLDKETVQLLVYDLESATTRGQLAQLLSMGHVDQTLIRQIYENHGRENLQPDTTKAIHNGFLRDSLTTDNLRKIESLSQPQRDAYIDILADQNQLLSGAAQRIARADQMNAQSLSEMMSANLSAQTLQTLRRSMCPPDNAKPVVTGPLLSKIVNSPAPTRNAYLLLLETGAADQASLTALLDARSQPGALATYHQSLQDKAISPEAFRQIAKQPDDVREVFERTILPGEIGETPTIGAKNLQMVLQINFSSDELRGLHEAARSLGKEDFATLLTNDPSIVRQSVGLCQRQSQAGSALIKQYLTTGSELTPQAIAQADSIFGQVRALNLRAELVVFNASELYARSQVAGFSGGPLTMVQALEGAALVEARTSSTGAVSLADAPTLLAKVESVRSELGQPKLTLTQALALQDIKQFYDLKDYADAQKLQKEADRLVDIADDASTLRNFSAERALHMAALERQRTAQGQRACDLISFDGGKGAGFTPGEVFAWNAAELAQLLGPTEQISALHRLQPGLTFSEALKVQEVSGTMNAADVEALGRELAVHGDKRSENLQSLLLKLAKEKASSTDAGESTRWSAMAEVLAKDGNGAKALTADLADKAGDTAIAFKIAQSLTVEQVNNIQDPAVLTKLMRSMTAGRLAASTKEPGDLSISMHDAALRMALRAHTEPEATGTTETQRGAFSRAWADLIESTREALGLPINAEFLQHVRFDVLSNLNAKQIAELSHVQLNRLMLGTSDTRLTEQMTARDRAEFVSNFVEGTRANPHLDARQRNALLTKLVEINAIDAFVMGRLNPDVASELVAVAKSELSRREADRTARLGGTEQNLKRLSERLFPDAVTRESAEALLGGLNATDRARAIEYLAGRSNALTTAGLRAEFATVASELEQNQLMRTSADRGRPIQKITALALTSEGRALAYEFRKSTGIAVDVIGPNDRIPEGTRMVLFDAPERLAAGQKLTADRLTALIGDGSAFQSKSLTAIGSGVNLFDLAAMGVNADGARNRLDAAIGAKRVPGDGTTLTDGEFDRLSEAVNEPVRTAREASVARGLVHMVSLDTDRALFEAQHYARNPNLISNERMMRQARSLHEQIMGSRGAAVGDALPSNLVFLSIERGGHLRADSSMLALQMYRAANGLTDSKYDSHFLTSSELQTRLTRAAKTGEKLEIVIPNDLGSTFGEANEVLHRVRTMAERSDAKASLTYAPFSGYAEGLEGATAGISDAKVLLGEPPFHEYKNEVSRNLSDSSKDYKLREGTITDVLRQQGQSNYGVATGAVHEHMYSNTTSKPFADLLRAMGASGAASELVLGSDRDVASTSSTKPRAVSTRPDNSGPAAYSKRSTNPESTDQSEKPAEAIEGKERTNPHENARQVAELMIDRDFMKSVTDSVDHPELWKKAGRNSETELYELSTSLEARFKEALAAKLHEKGLTLPASIELVEMDVRTAAGYTSRGGLRKPGSLNGDARLFILVDSGSRTQKPNELKPLAISGENLITGKTNATATPIQNAKIDIFVPNNLVTSANRTEGLSQVYQQLVKLAQLEGRDPALNLRELASMQAADAAELADFAGAIKDEKSELARAVKAQGIEHRAATRARENASANSQTTIDTVEPVKESNPLLRRVGSDERVARPAGRSHDRPGHTRLIEDAIVERFENRRSEARQLAEYIDAKHVNMTDESVVYRGKFQPISKWSYLLDKASAEMKELTPIRESNRTTDGEPLTIKDAQLLRDTRRTVGADNAVDTYKILQAAGDLTSKGAWTTDEARNNWKLGYIALDQQLDTKNVETRAKAEALLKALDSVPLPPGTFSESGALKFKLGMLQVQSKLDLQVSERTQIVTHALEIERTLKQNSNGTFEQMRTGAVDMAMSMHLDGRGSQAPRPSDMDMLARLRVLSHTAPEIGLVDAIAGLKHVPNFVQLAAGEAGDINSMRQLGESKVDTLRRYADQKIAGGEQVVIWQGLKEFLDSNSQPAKAFAETVISLAEESNALADLTREKLQTVDPANYARVLRGITEDHLRFADSEKLMSTLDRVLTESLLKQAGAKPVEMKALSEATWHLVDSVVSLNSDTKLSKVFEGLSNNAFHAVMRSATPETFATLSAPEAKRLQQCLLIGAADRADKLAAMDVYSRQSYLQRWADVIEMGYADNASTRAAEYTKLIAACQPGDVGFISEHYAMHILDSVPFSSLENLSESDIKLLTAKLRSSLETKEFGRAGKESQIATSVRDYVSKQSGQGELQAATEQVLSQFTNANERATAATILAERARHLSPQALGVQLRKMAELLEPGIATPYNSMRTGFQNAKRVTVLVTGESTPGHALAVMLRNETGMSLDIQVIKPGMQLPPGAAILLDPLPGDPGLARQITDRQKAQPAQGKIIVPSEVLDFHNGVNMFDLAKAPLSEAHLSAVTEKLKGQVAKRSASMSEAGSAQGDVHKVMESVDVASGHAQRLMELRALRYFDNMKDNGTAIEQAKAFATATDFLSPGEAMKLALELKDKIAVEADLSKALFIVDLDKEGSSHLITHLFREANPEFKDSQFISVQEARERAAQGKLNSSNSLIYLDDCVDSGRDSAKRVFEMVDVAESSSSRPKVIAAMLGNFVGEVEGLDGATLVSVRQLESVETKLGRRQSASPDLAKSMGESQWFGTKVTPLVVTFYGVPNNCPEKFVQFAHSLGSAQSNKFSIDAFAKPMRLVSELLPLTGRAVSNGEVIAAMDKVLAEKLSPVESHALRQLKIAMAGTDAQGKAVVDQVRASLNLPALDTTASDQESALSKRSTEVAERTGTTTDKTRAGATEYEQLSPGLSTQIEKLNQNVVDTLRTQTPQSFKQLSDADFEVYVADAKKAISPLLKQFAEVLNLPPELVEENVTFDNVENARGKYLLQKDRIVLDITDPFPANTAFHELVHKMHRLDLKAAFVSDPAGARMAVLDRTISGIGKPGRIVDSGEIVARKQFSTPDLAQEFREHVRTEILQRLHNAEFKGIDAVPQRKPASMQLLREFGYSEMALYGEVLKEVSNYRHLIETIDNCQLSEAASRYVKRQQGLFERSSEANRGEAVVRLAVHQELSNLPQGDTAESSRTIKAIQERVALLSAKEKGNSSTGVQVSEEMITKVLKSYKAGDIAVETKRANESARVFAIAGVAARQFEKPTTDSVRHDPYLSKLLHTATVDRVARAGGKPEYAFSSDEIGSRKLEIAERARRVRRELKDGSFEADQAAVKHKIFEEFVDYLTQASDQQRLNRALASDDLVEAKEIATKLQVKLATNVEANASYIDYLVMNKLLGPENIIDSLKDFDRVAGRARAISMDRLKRGAIDANDAIGDGITTDSRTEYTLKEPITVHRGHYGEMEVTAIAVDKNGNMSLDFFDTEGELWREPVEHHWPGEIEVKQENGFDRDFSSTEGTENGNVERNKVAFFADYLRQLERQDSIQNESRQNAGSKSTSVEDPNSPSRKASPIERRPVQDDRAPSNAEHPPGEGRSLDTESHRRSATTDATGNHTPASGDLQKFADYARTQLGVEAVGALDQRPNSSVSELLETYIVENPSAAKELTPYLVAHSGEPNAPAILAINNLIKAEPSEHRATPSDRTSIVRPGGADLDTASGPPDTRGKQAARKAADAAVAFRGPQHERNAPLADFAGYEIHIQPDGQQVLVSVSMHDLTIKLDPKNKESGAALLEERIAWAEHLGNREAAAELRIQKEKWAKTQTASQREQLVVNLQKELRGATEHQSGGHEKSSRGAKLLATGGTVVALLMLSDSFIPAAKADEIKRERVRPAALPKKP